MLPLLLLGREVVVPCGSLEAAQAESGPHGRRVREFEVPDFQFHGDFLFPAVCGRQGHLPFVHACRCPFRDFYGYPERMVASRGEVLRLEVCRKGIGPESGLPVGVCRVLDLDIFHLPDGKGLRRKGGFLRLEIGQAHFQAFQFLVGPDNDLEGFPLVAGTPDPDSGSLALRGFHVLHYLVRSFGPPDGCLGRGGDRVAEASGRGVVGVDLLG